MSKNMQVAFLHKKGNSDLIIPIDEGVLRESIDNEDVARFIEMKTKFKEVEIISIDFE